MTNYSQNDEQDKIQQFFGTRVGRFLDIGAYNGTELSNTRALLERGWSGVMVEPNPYNLVPLIESVRPFSDRVKVVQAAVGPYHGAATLRMDDTEGRGWAASISDKNPGVLRPSPVPLLVSMVAPSALLIMGPFQFISIDAEHMDLAILKVMPEDMGGCELLCIEPANLVEREEMRRILTGFRFRTYHETPENLMMARP